MSKLSSFVRKYGEEIGIVGRLFLSVAVRLIPNAQDRANAAEAAQRLIEASNSIAASWQDIQQAIPSADEVADNLKPILVQIVADMVEAELSRRLGVNPATVSAVQAGALADHTFMHTEGPPPPPTEEKAEEADK